MINFILYEKDAESSFVLEILRKFDSYFIPRIGERIVLEDYADKISKNAHLFVANLNLEIVGFVAFYFNSKPMDSYLPLIAVSNNYQNAGIGKSLVEKMEIYCTENNSSGIKLEVRADNSKLLKFYSSLGFEILERFISPFNNEEKYYLYKKLINE